VVVVVVITVDYMQRTGENHVQAVIFNSIWRTNRTRKAGKFRESARGTPDFK
jgi:hypothetical protein